jgi:hypothetical protein
MHTFQLNSHINENGILSVKLPKEWAEKDVNVLLVLEFLNQLKESTPKKESLAVAFDLLTQMPEDFMPRRQDNFPQENELTAADIEQACGILTASHGVTLAQMDETIKKRGGSL